MTKSFNHENQVGGNHYNQGDKPQHWDLAIIYGWDAFQYQITKYVMRWKDKHDTRAKRLEDLKKARSFLDKYIENYEVYDRDPGPLPPTQVEVNATVRGLLDTMQFGIPVADPSSHDEKVTFPSLAGDQAAAVAADLQIEAWTSDGYHVRCKTCRETYMTDTLTPHVTCASLETPG